MKDIKEITLPQGTIRYRDVGTGPVVVFVHGVFVTGSLWNKTVDTLSAHCRCIVPDWPLGAHELPMNADADLSPHGVAQLVADFVAALDLRDVTLVGNDSGGAVCQLVVTAHPERIGKIVLTSCDAFDRFPPPDFQYLAVLPKVPALAYMMAKVMHWFPRLVESKYAFGTGAKHGYDRAQLQSWTRPAATQRGVRRDMLKFIAGAGPHVTMAVAKQLPDVKIPALMLWASECKHFPLSYGERLRDAFSNGRLVAVDDSYLFVPLDRPDVVAAEVAAFASDQRERVYATS